MSAEAFTWITDALLLVLAYAFGRMHASALYRRKIDDFIRDLRELRAMVRILRQQHEKSMKEVEKIVIK